MKLYPKRLRTLEELKREKQVLRYARKHTNSESLLDLNELGIGKPGNKGNPGEAGLLGVLISALGSKSMLNTALTVAPSLLGLVSRGSGAKNFIGRIAKEVGFGYVKWKVVQMAYRGVMMVVRSKKNKRQEKTK